MVSHRLNNSLGRLCEERALEPEEPAETGSSAKDQPEDVIPPFVSWEYSVSDEESDSSTVVSNHPIRNDVCPHCLFIMAQELPSTLHNWQKEICVIIVIDPLEHRSDTL